MVTVVELRRELLWLSYYRSQESDLRPSPRGRPHRPCVECPDCENIALAVRDGLGRVSGYTCRSCGREVRNG